VKWWCPCPSVFIAFSIRLQGLSVRGIRKPWLSPGTTPAGRSAFGTFWDRLGTAPGSADDSAGIETLQVVPVIEANWFLFVAALLVWLLRSSTVVLPGLGVQLVLQRSL